MRTKKNPRSVSALGLSIATIIGGNISSTKCFGLLEPGKDKSVEVILYLVLVQTVLVSPVFSSCTSTGSFVTIRSFNTRISVSI
jgi:hypothetical protein